MKSKIFIWNFKKSEQFFRFLTEISKIPVYLHACLPGIIEFPIVQKIGVVPGVLKFLVVKFIKSYRKFQNFRWYIGNFKIFGSLIIFCAFHFAVKTSGKDVIITGMVTNREDARARAVEVESSQLMVGRIVPTGSHRKQLAEPV